jgi:hypothetical protein
MVNSRPDDFIAYSCIFILIFIFLLFSTSVLTTIVGNISISMIRTKTFTSTWLEKITEVRYVMYAPSLWNCARFTNAHFTNINRNIFEDSRKFGYPQYLMSSRRQMTNKSDKSILSCLFSLKFLCVDELPKPCYNLGAIQIIHNTFSTLFRPP